MPQAKVRNDDINELLAKVLPAWEQNTLYEINEKILYNDNLYICLENHTSSSSFDGTKWDMIGTSISLATNSGLELNSGVLNMGAPSTITNSSLNSVTNNTHSHAISGFEPSFSKNTAFNKNFETDTNNIKMNGSVSVGILDTLPRADHVHPTDTTREPTLTKGNLTETVSSSLIITGGTNAVIGSGVTIQLPQDIKTNSDVQFKSANLTDGLKDTDVTTAIHIGDSSNTSLNTTNKTFTGAINELDLRVNYNSFGVVVLPTLTKNPDGTVTIGNNGIAIFNTLADGTGDYIKLPCTTGTTLSFADGSVNYIYADYNNGNPIFSSITSPSTFLSNSTLVPITRAIREGNTIHFEEYDQYGVELSNKLLYKDVALRSFERQTGLVLSTVATRISILSSGFAWFGVQYFNLAENRSGTSGLLFEYYKISNIWNKSLVTSYDSIYYSDGINRLSLGNNKWVSKYFFRDIGDDNEVYYIHGNEYNTASEAVSESLPTAPDTVTSHSLYVGKIVIQKDALVGTAYPRRWEGALAISGVQNHNDLANLQGGELNAYYHSNQAINTTNDVQFKSANLTDGLKDTDVTTAIHIGDSSNTSLNTTNKTFVGSINELNSGKEPTFSKNTAFNKNFETSTSNIKMNGTVSVGALDTVPRADHIHPSDTSKVDANIAITGATKTKITYDSKGLVTAGADATTADISASTDKNYVTDAHLVILGNTSGTNSGDVTLATDSGLQFTSGQTGLKLGTPSTLNGASTNSVSGSSHSHQVTGFEPTLTKGNLTEAVTNSLTITGGTGAVIGNGTSIQLAQNIRTDSSPSFVDVTLSSLNRNFTTLGTDLKTQTGIPHSERTKFKLDLLYSSGNITASLSFTGSNTSFSYYINSKKFNVTVANISAYTQTALASEGVWFFYINQTTTNADTPDISLTKNPWAITDPDVLLFNLYFDATNNVFTWIGYEKHLAGRDIFNHARNHAQGAIYRNGFIFSTYNGLSALSSNTDNNFGRAILQVSNGSFFDEDILNSVVHTDASIESTNASPYTDWGGQVEQFLGFTAIATTGTNATTIVFPTSRTLITGQAVTVMQGDTTTVRGTTTISAGGTGTTFTVTSVTGLASGDAIVVGARIPIYYISSVSGANYTWRKLITTDFLGVTGGSAYTTANISSGQAQFNNATSGGFSNITAGRYFAVYLIATNFTSEPVIAVLGQAQSTSINLTTALTEAGFQYQNLVGLSGLGIQEIVPFYRITYEYNSTGQFTNTRIKIVDATFLNVRVSTASGSIISGSPTTTLSASQVTNDVTNFDGILSSSNTNVQSALETIDEFGKLNSANIYVGNSSNLAAKVELSGDATISNTGALTIANDAITYAKIQNVSATSRILGRVSSGAGDIEELTGAQVSTIIRAGKTSIDAYQSSGTTLARNAFTAVVFNVENRDTASEYDTSTGVYTPSATKVVSLTTGVSVVTGINTGKLYILALYRKVGAGAWTEWRRLFMFYTTATTHLMIMGSITFQADSGTTYAVYAYHNESANVTTYTGESFSWLTIHEL